jgi:hypothetical protein
MPERKGGLEVVDPRYRELWDRTVTALGNDERVRSVALSGSVGKNTADAWSDLDLVVVAHAERFDEFLADWPKWLHTITPTVFARTPIAPFVINAVTDEGLTLDLVVHKGEQIDFPMPAGYAVGLLGGVRFAEIGPALEYAVNEQLRGMAGPFVSLVQREEHLRHLTGLPHLVGLLTTVFLAENGAPPLGKHWNDSFTAEQLGAVAALPPASATRDGVIGFGMALAQLLVTRARPLFPRYELDWPSDFAHVVADRVRATVGIETSDWCY